MTATVSTKSVFARVPVLGAQLYLLVAICTVVAMLEGFDTQAMSIAASMIMADFAIDRSQMGVIFACGQAGMVLGAVLGGLAGDAFGRRNAMLLGVLCFGIFCTATVALTGFFTLALARGIVGIGIGLVLPNLISIAAECAPARHRGKMISIVLAGLPGGGMIVALIGSAYLGIWGWRSLFYIGGLIPLILLVPICLLPNYRPEKLGRFTQTNTQRVQALFGESRTLTTLLLWVALSLTAALLYMVVSWLPSLLTQRGYGLQISNLSSAMITGGGCIGSLAAGFFIDRFGHSRVLPLLYVGIAIGICGVIFAVDSNFILVSAFILGFFGVGSFYSLNGVSPFYYPAAFRSFGTGAAVGIGRMGSVVGPLAAGFVLQNGIGPFPAGPNAMLPIALPVTLLACIAVLLVTRRPQEPITVSYETDKNSGVSSGLEQGRYGLKNQV
jgi:AAHS family 3-hydroxyphenylpropionic acid transporter